MAGLLPNEKGIEFDPELHAYTINGKRYPSVTQLMKPMSALVYGDVDPVALHEAADRGTRAHEQISNFVQYGLWESDEDTEPYVESFKRFLKLYRPVWVASEHMVVHHTMGYVGTADLIGYVDGDTTADGLDLVDLKCTAAWHPVLLAAQTSAYAEALRSAGVKIRATYGLQLLRDGNFRFERLKDGYKTFLHSMAVMLEMIQGEGVRI